MAANDPTIRTDLDWLAFCYVDGELSAEESSAFEDRLAREAAACEAVARAMKLNLAVVAACNRDSQAALVPMSRDVPDVVITTPARRGELAATSRWTGAVTTVVAASAIAAVGIVLSIGPALTGGKIAKREGADRLVASWAAGEAVRNSVDDDSDSLDATDDDLEPPDWLLAAVTAEQRAKPLPNDDDHEVREN